MEESNKSLKFEEVLDSEIDDIWDIFFPYMAEKKETLQKLEETEKPKSRRHLRFIAM